MLVYLYICRKHLRLNPQVDLFPSMFSTQGPSKNANVHQMYQLKKTQLAKFLQSWRCQEKIENILSKWSYNSKKSDLKKVTKMAEVVIVCPETSWNYTPEV